MCRCGFTQWLIHETRNGTTHITPVVHKNEILLPAQGTKIQRCLMIVASFYSDPVMTSKVVEHTGLEGKETSSLLGVLVGRGLVTRVEGRRGLPGGSTWTLSYTAYQKLKTTGVIGCLKKGTRRAR